MEMKFYVYTHTRNDTNTVFYVGKGSKKRSHSKADRNKYWHSIVNKVGYSVEIIEYFELEVDALKREIELISSYRPSGECEANFNEGGTGLSGRKHTEESLKKISDRSKGKNNPMYGLKRPHSLENIKKMRGENHPYSKKVIDIVTKTIYQSLGEAARQNGYKPPTLATMLNGWRKNKTTLVYLENYYGTNS